MTTFTGQTASPDHSMFPDHTIESAPAASRPAMEATAKQMGYLPAAVARLASSPELLNGFLKMTALFDTTTLEPVARRSPSSRS